MKGVIRLEDEKILDLYWARNEQAILATAEKYGAYCTTVAHNILGDAEDAAECVNDTYLRTWDAIPPAKPERLGTFLGKITRNLALDRYRRSTAQKRGGSEYPLALEELGDCLSGGDSTAQALDRRELAAAIDSFLAGLPAKKRNIFVSRYWYFDSIATIAARQDLSESNVSAILSRVRRSLKKHLTERGFDL